MTARYCQPYLTAISAQPLGLGRIGNHLRGSAGLRAAVLDLAGGVLGTSWTRGLRRIRPTLWPSAGVSTISASPIVRNPELALNSAASRQAAICLGGSW